MKKTTLLMAITLIVFCLSKKAYSQTDSTLKDIGVAVSPSHINFNIKSGESKTYEVTITNETKVKRSFKMSLKDFDMDKSGHETFMAAGSGEHSLSKWISVSPTFVELLPGVKQKIRVTLNVPDTEGANSAAWCVMMIEEAKERQKLESEGGDQKIAFGILPPFAFGVFIYQNPPVVKNNKVEIKNFAVQSIDNKPKNIELTLVNTGDGIAACSAYIQLTNTNTGVSRRLLVKSRFVVLPGYTRNYLYSLPEKLEKGKYSAVGVLDYGSKDVVEAAEVEFEVK
jgi:hypothetical protein